MRLRRELRRLDVAADVVVVSADHVTKWAEVKSTMLHEALIEGAWASSAVPISGQASAGPVAPPPTAVGPRSIVRGPSPVERGHRCLRSRRLLILRIDHHLASLGRTQAVTDKPVQRDDDDF